MSVGERITIKPKPLLRMNKDDGSTVRLHRKDVTSLQA